MRIVIDVDAGMAEPEEREQRIRDAIAKALDEDGDNSNLYSMVQSDADGQPDETDPARTFYYIAEWNPSANW